MTYPNPPFVRLRALAGILLALLTVATLSGQQDAGGLIISVRDPNGAVVPGAGIVVTNVATNQTLKGVTTGTGDFTVSPLRPGRYQATIRHTGFTTATSQIVTVGAQQIPRLDIALVVGSVTETVNVTAEATL